MFKNIFVVFHALVLKGVFQETKECVGGVIEDCLPSSGALRSGEPGIHNPGWPW
jgi:hypothetical protein